MHMMRTTPTWFLTVFVAMTAAGSEQFAKKVPAITLPSREPLRFIVTGDTDGSNSLREGMIAVHRVAAVDGIILAGDNHYECGVTSSTDPRWHRYVKNFSFLGVPIYPLLGNHDYGNPLFRANGTLLDQCRESDPSAQLDVGGRVPGWTFPARSYVMSSALVDFIMLDTLPIAMNARVSYRGSATKDEQMQWLKEMLVRTKARWKIVVGHHVMYSSGLHGGQDGPERLRMRSLVDLFRSQGATLYICGHDHHMELLGNVKVRPLYLVSGAGDRDRIRTFEKRAASPASIFLPERRVSGFSLLEVWRSKLVVEFYDAGGRRLGRVEIPEKNEF
jgi:tartrate-resistant acid phosphatase type 5